MASKEASVGGMRNKLAVSHSAFSIVCLHDENKPITDESGTSSFDSCGMEILSKTGLVKRTTYASSVPMRIRFGVSNILFLPAIQNVKKLRALH